jgi:DNA-binding transcriptional MerR regulator
LVDVQPHVLRYWESEFPMLAPQKNKAGQRVYRRKDVEMVVRIRELLYDEGFTIAGAKRKLASEARGGAGARLKVVTPEVEAELSGAEQKAEPGAPHVSPQARRSLKRIRRELEALLTILDTDDIKTGRR